MQDRSARWILKILDLGSGYERDMAYSWLVVAQLEHYQRCEGSFSLETQHFAVTDCGSASWLAGLGQDKENLLAIDGVSSIEFILNKTSMLYKMICKSTRTKGGHWRKVFEDAILQRNRWPRLTHGVSFSDD